MAEPTVVRVESPDDPRLADYVGLTDVELRRRTEPARGLFMAEGEKVIRRALAAGYPLRSLLLEERWLPALQDVVAGTQAPVYVAPRALLAQVTGYDVHRGALAAMARTPLPEAGDLLAGARRLAVLEDVNDHTNVGAVFRAAAGLGLDAVLLSPSCADPLYRRSVKVSMGAVFALPWARLPAWPAGLDLIRDRGFSVLALTPDEDAVPIDDVPTAMLQRCAVLLGAEGPGLSARSLRRADARVRIPMAHGVDSLNVAAAAAVAFYALRLPAAGQSRR
ncbi:MAG: TrmH family RNA methyltransferase [Actinomycetes bacterium]